MFVFCLYIFFFIVSGHNPNRSAHFTEAIIDLIIPRPLNDSEMFLSGKENTKDSVEYIQCLHGLQKEFFSDVPILLNRKVMKMLRQNLGGLLYFGFYNMLHSNKDIRNRSFLFVKELFSFFNSDPELDIKLYFGMFMGILMFFIVFNYF